MIEKLGHYKIVSELGRGGMGVVYKAYEESLNRYVAIKVLGEHLGHDENFVKRFVREARAAAGLSHPNVIQIYFIGNDEGRNYFVMEFVEGRSVHDVLKEEGAIEPVRAARIVQQAASGLATAHDQGLVHRDIKPANLLITRDQRVKIADFGLALSPTDGATRLTATNSLMGTPGYLSPEQCCGEPAGPKSDIYSLGMTFYEMLSGSIPWKGESPLAVLRQILDVEPPSLLQIDPDLDPRLARVVERMVAKEPNDRFQSCHEVVAALDEILGTRAPGTAIGARPGAATVPAVPGAALASSAGTQATVTGRPQDAPTQLVPPEPSQTAVQTVATRTQPAAAVVPPPPPPPAVARATAPAAPQAAVPPVVAANATAKSGMGGRWVLIGVMAAMLVIAVSAAGLYFAAPVIKDAPFLRDVPFFKDDVEIEQADADEPATRDATAASRVASAPPVARGAAAPSSEASSGSFETISPDADDGSSRDASSASRSTASGGGSDAGAPAVAAHSAAGGGAAVRDAPAPPAGDASARSPAAPPAAPNRDASAAKEIAERAPAPAAPPPRRAAVRAKPRVAVIGTGEATFASAAEEALESQLARHGVDLYDERGILELRDSGGASRVAPSDLLHLVAGRGVDVMVLIDVEPLRERELQASGRYSYATTSRVRVDAYLAGDGDAVGRGWSEQVEYAELNAVGKADASMGGWSTEIAEAIDAVWQDVRSGAR